ncbi:hypothetical protein [Salmonella enterica]|uniref:hypothetical protein n=1 Tax=Salmonella enterica TaxID=28901 RepID=UPI0009AD9B83|nr:hypothetical protein [Salmonella enterica]
MRHIRSVLWKFSRGLYVLSSIMLLVLLVLVLKDACGVMWRGICLALFLGAAVYRDHPVWTGQWLRDVAVAC